jgi:hypothetical protein
MAASELIATGAGAANSSDIVVSDTPIQVAMKGDADANCEIYITAKDDAGAYRNIGSLKPAGNLRSTVLTAAGTYRLTRPAWSSSCGAYQAA